MGDLHGIQIFEKTNGTRPVTDASTAVIGLIATADDADPIIFPLNTPVLTLRPLDMVQYAGKSGTLNKTLSVIGKIVNTPTIIVRVAEGADEAEQTANVIGTVDETGKKTGMQALLVAKNKLSIEPQIFGAPYLDNLNVAVELAGIAKKLNGFVYVSANGCVTKEDAANYRKNFSQREVMVIDGEYEAFNVITSQVEPVSSVAVALALRAYIDKTIGWHKTLSNVGVTGVAGITKDYFFDINDPDTDVNYLNMNDVTTPINFNGFRFWGSRTCSDDPAFMFESYTRTAQVIKRTFASAYSWAVDKPITPMLAKVIIEMIDNKFKEWKALGYIVDGEAWFDSQINTVDTLKAGKLRIKYKYCPIPPLEQLEFYQYITDEYLADFASLIASA